MEKIKFFIRDYFGFSQKETNGFVILLFLMLGFIFLPFVTSLFNTNQEVSAKDQEILNQQLTQLEEGLAAIADSTQTNKAELFPFDPNNLEVSEWEKLGVKTYLAERINNYVSKGGRFRKKADLRKIYGFPEWLYAELEAYIQLPDEAPKYSKKTERKPYKKKDYKKYEDKDDSDSKKDDKPKKSKPSIQPFDINTASVEDLKQIRGIGDTFANRIISFRKLLGGFVNESQLYEVYGLKDNPETIEELLKYINFDLSQVKKININTASKGEIKRHPYVKTWDEAQAIVDYRERIGKIPSFKVLITLSELNQENFKKLEPYLEF